MLTRTNCSETFEMPFSIVYQVFGSQTNTTKTRFWEVRFQYLVWGVVTPIPQKIEPIGDRASLFFII